MIREDSTCNTAIRINANSTWYFDWLGGFDNNCGILPIGGTYTLTYVSLFFMERPEVEDKLRGRVDL
ncbi:hypothetical protein [Algoriphagus sp. PAP.12]|uniref:hypothetical protein n=1 Tax=Algoriphagus sp. PAP.12 TaxID=2996678 RepID=UPI00227CA421|nr:hypothetical protein [Algoriphagus sp. PAP.12]